jgi:hypothetical protein
MTPACETLQPTTEGVRQLPAPNADRPALETVLDEIRQDCRVWPSRYLEEVVVPFGGE